MFIIAKLVFQHYMPIELLPGMMFQQQIKDVVYGKTYEYTRIFMLKHKPMNQEAYIEENGYPVHPWIYSVTSNPDDNAKILARPKQIGWWDDDPFDDSEDAELRDIELKDFNYILQEEDGYIDIEGTFEKDEFGHDIFVPTLYMDKVTLRVVTDDEEYILEEEQEDEEDFDDMDDWTHDEPDTDSAGFTQYDRYNPDDYETE